MSYDNEADWDRATRMLVGIMLLYAGWGGFVFGAVAAVVIVVGILALVTGLVGWCPIYAALHFSTKLLADNRD